MIQIVWHHPIFEETAIGFHDALFMNRIESRIVKIDEGTRFGDDLYIVLGLHRLRDIPDNFVAVQAEQVGSRCMTEGYLQRLSCARCVWDFSPRNVEYFTGKGIRCVLVGTRVPMDIFFPGSDPMYRHFSGREKDIDVLFYGAKCARRKSIENAFIQSGLKAVFRYYNLFNDERDELVSRAKIVVNVHYWPMASLETHRIEYLCSRGKCILSERSSDEELDKEYETSVVFSPIGEMVTTSKKLLKSGKTTLVGSEAQRLSILRQIDTKNIKDSLDGVPLSL